MTAIAVIFMILAAILTGFTVVTQSQDIARTTIVGAVTVSPASIRSEQATQAENTQLMERVHALENRLASIQLKQTNLRLQDHSKHSK